MWLFLAACTFVTDAEWAARTPACSTDGLFLDLDGDGYGRQAARTCEEAAEAIPTNGDCDDGNPAINPAAAEVWYDGIDEDCDDLDDYDADKDGYASALHSDGPDCMDQPTDPVPTKAGGDCEEPSGAPTPAQVHPGAEDVAYDGVDMDCSGGTDFDGDHDGYATCDGDCDDGVSTVNPGVPEAWYDGVDQDCDGNDGDKDEDGYLAEAYTGDLPAGALPGDCDDEEGATHPGATDVFYDGVDADCAGNDDYDGDEDGVDDPRGGGDDCDDDDATISPLETEDCATAWDDDCDGATDALNAVGCSVWYLDADGDGLGSAASVCTCAPDGDYVAASATDCDDGDAAVTIPVWYVDVDGDGAGVPDTTAAACAVPAGYAATADDCDDAERATYPGAAEACDTVDSDCDGELNDADALTGCTEFYADDDGDAYAGARSECLCVAEGDYLFAAEDDCDDADADVNPGAAEVCNDGADDDCDGAPGACSFGGALTTLDASGTWYGAAAGDEAGGVLLAGGDLDGDGLDELLTALPGYAGASADGLVAVLRPTVDVGAPLDGVTFTVGAGSANLDFGATLATPGDLDGDGHGDVLLGSPSLVGGSYGELRRFTALGSGFVPATSADLLVEGSDSSREVRTAGGGADGDGNGVVDLLVGDPDSAGGYVRGVPADLSGTWALSSATAWTIQGEASSDGFGASITVADVDGDGLSDAVIGASGVDGGYGDDGAVYVLLASSAHWSSAASDADLMYTLACPSCAAGSVPAVVADFDGDGAAELAFSSSRASYGGVWIVPGSLSGTWYDASSLAEVRIPEPGEGLGTSLTAGDLDGDGAVELVVGAPNANSDAGAAYVFAGPLASGTYGTSAASATISPASASASASGVGSAVAVLGDTDDDGFGDLAIGAAGDDTAGSAAGAVWLFSGGGY